jgi:hypothetical protein
MKNQLNEFFNRIQFVSGKPLNEDVNEAKKEKPSAGLSKEKKSEIVKKAKKGGDIGKKGKGFEKIAKKAAKEYGSEEKGRAVAAASMWKNIKREGVEGGDHEVSMAKSSLESIISSAQSLMDKLGNDERNIPGWIQDHITNSENYIDQAAQGFHELDGEENTESDELYEEENADPGFEVMNKYIKTGKFVFEDPMSGEKVKIKSFDQFLSIMDKYAKAELVLKAAFSHSKNENFK